MSAPGAGPAGDRTARALIVRDPHAIEVATLDVPAVGRDEVLVRTRSSGICGLGEIRTCARRPAPCGWSAVGRVVRSSNHVEEGTLIFAVRPHQDVFVAPVSEVMPLDGLRPRLGTLLPAAVKALEIVRRADIGTGHVAAVMGLGPVGIMAAALLRSEGARVVGSDRAAWRMRVAEAFGVVTVEPDGLAEAVGDAAGGAGADVLVHAVDDGEPFDDGWSRLLREGGRRLDVLVGPPLRPRAGRLAPMSRDPDWNRARGLLEELPVALLATHEFPFERAEDAYGAVAEDEWGLIHAALVYP